MYLIFGTHQDAHDFLFRKHVDPRNVALATNGETVLQGRREFIEMIVYPHCPVTPKSKRAFEFAQLINSRLEKENHGI